MLKLDINRLMDHRGIQNPRSFLVKSGFTYQSSRRLLKGEMACAYFIEMLCIILNCTPNDLFSWTPDSDLKSPNALALSKLSGRKQTGNILRKLKNVPEHKIEELHTFLDTLTNPE